MAAHRIFTTSFASIYPLYLAKVERKGRTQAELDEVIGWLTGYDTAGLQRGIARGVTMEGFFAEAPAFSPYAALITGVICGYRVEEIEDPFMREIRHLDKLVDEVSKGKAMEKVLRAG